MYDILLKMGYGTTRPLLALFDAMSRDTLYCLAQSNEWRELLVLGQEKKNGRGESNINKLAAQ